MVVRLKFIREKYDLTQKQVANILKIKHTSYSYFENGKRLMPLKDLNKFCNYFNVSMDYVLGLSECNIVCKSNIILNKNLIGTRLKEIRKMKGYTQNKLATLINTSQSTISSYEQGKTLIITAFLYDFCKRTHISMDYIIGRNNIIYLLEYNY